MINLNVDSMEQIVEEYEQSLESDRFEFRNMVIANLNHLIRKVIEDNMIEKQTAFSFYHSPSHKFGISVSLDDFHRKSTLKKQYKKWAQELVFELEDVNWTFKLSKDGKNILCLSNTYTKKDSK